MKLTIYTDGGSRGNPGPAAFAVVITEDGKVIKEYARYAGRITNNEAEYGGALSALKEALTLGADEVELVSDSELMVKHVNGQYACKAANLRPMLDEVCGLMQQFEKASFRHVPRGNHMIARADRLVNDELDIMSSLHPKGKPNP
jgi:ribonuclease HI